MSLILQSYFRSVRHGTSLQTFNENNPFKTGIDCNETTWTGLLISVFECDVICHQGVTQTLRLALVMWLEAEETNTQLDKLQNTQNVTGTGKDGWYDLIEVDRIIGPEYIVPSMEMSDQGSPDDASDVYVLGERDFRKRPITTSEKWTRVVMARTIGSAHPVMRSDRVFPHVSTGNPE